MANAGPQVPEVPAPLPPPTLQQTGHASHLIGHISSQIFQANQKRMQRHSYLELMIGWTYIKSKKDVKVQRFCLALVGEARLWYKSLIPINVYCLGLWNQFKQQYSKIGNTREQLFHVWHSFHFDENSETFDTYVTHIRQVAVLLGYGEPHILEVFKNTLPTRLYWVLFPIEDLRQVVEAAKRILMKEKIDRQLVGQSASTTPFMSTNDTFSNSKRVTFIMKDS